MSEAAVVNTDGFVGARTWLGPVFEAPPSAARPRSTAAPEETPEMLRERVRREAHAEGLASARVSIERVQRLLDALARPYEDLQAETEQTLVALTIEIARRLAYVELELDPTRVLRVVREAVSALAQPPRDIRIALHPQDAAVLRPLLEADEESRPWRLVADAQLNRGDCRVSSEAGSVDARLDTRQAMLAQQLLQHPA